VSGRQVATIRIDDFGFVGAELCFRWDAAHPNGTLLREWVAELPGARWDKRRRAWIVPDVTDIPRGALTAAGFTVQHVDGTPAKRSDLPVPPTPQMAARPEVPLFPPSGELPSGDMGVPAWFGLDLYDYQREGALAIAAGRRLLADAPGVGKTRTALAAAAILGSKRTLVICPAVVVTHWTREAAASGLGHHAGDPLSGAPSRADLVPPEPAHPDGAPDNISVTTPPSTPGVVAVVASKKVPEFPDSGVLIIGAQLIRSRADLDRAVRAWCPTVFICDEAHLARTWGSQTSRVLRRIARSCPVTIPTTGTPVLSSPLELAPLLDMVGVLEPVYGGILRFRSHFTRKAKWGYSPIRKRLPELRRTLDDGVWVKRTKEEVLADLPPKSRRTLWVDVEDPLYSVALSSVVAVIDEWLSMVMTATGEPPSGDDIAEWVETSRGMVVRLRQAAGEAKVPVAAGLITEWFGDGTGVLAHPLVVWTHHHSVTEALVGALNASGIEWPGDGITVIDGTVDQSRRAETVDRFQAGHVPVLVCSIQAAGVGITLTRAREALFVETDWTPAMVLQAEDRQHRVGQESPVTYTTLVAAGTLDERVHAVLSAKAGVVESVMGGDHQVFAPVTERMLATDVLTSMVKERRALLISSTRRRKAAVA
jgi:hypothetical protein